LITLLQHHEQDQLEHWYDLEEKDQTAFLRALAKCFESHRDELKDYCSDLKPTEFSSLSLIYEGLSTYSFQFTEFLFSEIKRVVQLALDHEIDPDLTEVLTDIEMGLYPSIAVQEDVAGIHPADRAYHYWKIGIQFLTDLIRTTEARRN